MSSILIIPSIRKVLVLLSSFCSSSVENLFSFDNGSASDEHFVRKRDKEKRITTYLCLSQNRIMLKRQLEFSHSKMWFMVALAPNVVRLTYMSYLSSRWGSLPWNKGSVDSQNCPNLPSPLLFVSEFTTAGTVLFNLPFYWVSLV